jgi:hypothetical protein
MNLGWLLETFLILLAGQYLHVLTKIIKAKKTFAEKFSMAIFFTENKMSLLLNGSIILIAALALGRAHFNESLEVSAQTANTINIFGLVMPGILWVPLVKYALYLTCGYFAQSLFYAMLGGVRAKIRSKRENGGT